jgi:hypothetical protein
LNKEFGGSRDLLVWKSSRLNAANILIGNQEEEAMEVFNIELRSVEIEEDAKDVVLAGDTRLSNFKGRVIWLIFWKSM